MDKGKPDSSVVNADIELIGVFQLRLITQPTVGRWDDVARLPLVILQLDYTDKSSASDDLLSRERYGLTVPQARWLADKLNRMANEVSSEIAKRRKRGA